MIEVLAGGACWFTWLMGPILILLVLYIHTCTCSMYLLVFHFPKPVHKFSIFKATQRSLSSLGHVWVSPRPYFPNSQSYDFSSSHIQMWKLDCKEGWVPKNWFFWTAVLEKTLECPLDSNEIKPVNTKAINPEYSLEGLTLKLKLQYCVCVCVCVSWSVVSNSLRPHGLSMEFSRQEHWSGLPFPSLRDAPYTGIKLGSPALKVDSLPSKLPG